MKRIKRIISSSRLDRHGDIIDRSVLESSAELLKRNYLAMGIEHDPRIPPVGRFDDGWIEELPDGTAVLKSIAEIFEDTDELPPEIDKVIVERKFLPGQLKIIIDRSYENEQDLIEVREIAERFGSQYGIEAKKALDPLSVLILGGAYVLGSIGQGFFKEIGSDGYKWLKAKLTVLIANQRTKSKEQLLVFAFTVTHQGQTVLVQTILSNPQEEDIESFLANAVYDLDKIPAEHFDPRLHLSRLVYFYDKGGLTFRYAVRADGFPLTYHIAT